MTPTATYIAEENCLRELPHIKPPVAPNPDFYGGDSRALSQDTHDFVMEKGAYNAHLATLRKIPCDPSCKGLWADQQKVVENVDYEVRFVQCPECWLLVESFNCQECKHVAFPLVPAGGPDMPNLILTAFQNEPVNFLLSNALRHLTQDQQRQLCNALQERLPVPVSITDEAAKLYPDIPEAGDDGDRTIERGVYITCARQYMDTIEKLRAENVKMRRALEVHDEYAILLTDEINEILVYVPHGWKSTRYEKGKELRDKLEALK